MRGASIIAEFESRQAILPIQIRPDVTLRIYGIPHDMTLAEAQKITRIIEAHVAPHPEHPRMKEQDDGR